MNSNPYQNLTPPELQLLAKQKEQSTETLEKVLIIIFVLSYFCGFICTCLNEYISNITEEHSLDLENQPLEEQEELEIPLIPPGLAPFG